MNGDFAMRAGHREERPTPTFGRRLNDEGRRGVTLLELLVVIAVIALLVSILLPGLGAARRQGQATLCGSHLRELGNALQMYGNDYDGRLMPLAYWAYDIIGDGPVVYWWGADETDCVDYSRGFVWEYLARSQAGGGAAVGAREKPRAADSVMECPVQAWGTYRPQGQAGAATSTYGYNGYYLSPPQTPGYGLEIGHRPWLSFSHVRDPSRALAFADTLIDLGGSLPKNTALLDPPMLYIGGSWQENRNPTTCFRHDGRAEVVHVDGHVASYAAEGGASGRSWVGSVSRENDPHYVPDWRSW